MSLAAHFRRHGNTWLFVLGFILFCSIYEYGRVMNMRPFPHHISRQTSGLSFAYTYWEKGNALLDPQLQHLFSDDLTSGRTVAECPILYYAVGQLWRLTGPSEFAYRAFMLLLHFAASFALFRLLKRLLSHGGWAALVSLFFFTSPAIVYFAISFMPEVPALDLVLLGLAVLMRGGGVQRRRDIILAAILFALAGVLKISALMVPLALLILLAVETVLHRSPLLSPSFFRHRGFAWAALAAVLLTNVWWYMWAETFIRHHGGVRFSHSATWALWDLSPEEIARAWKGATEVTVWQLFDTPAWIALGLMLGFLLVHFRKVPPGAWVVVLSLVGGIALYTLLWFITLDGHEYYFILPMVLPMLLCGLFLWTLARSHPQVFRSPYARGLFGVLLFYHMVYAANNHWIRTRGDVPFHGEDFLPLFHPGEAAYWDMVQHWTLEPMLTIEPYNRSLGIQKDDLVMDLTDRTVCASLYLMRQRGWVNYGISTTDTAAWNARIRAGAKYLFLEEGQWDDRPELARYMQHPIGVHKGMRIFDLRTLAP